MVRRDLALAAAPEAVRELVRTGELAARTAVLMQGLPVAEQLAVAQRIKGMRSTRAAQYHVLESLKTRALAKTVERTLVDVVYALEELADLPSRRLADIYRIASGGVGRRSLSALVEQIVEQATLLKQALPDSAIKGEVAGEWVKPL
jgi:hypothetical protein